MGEGMGDGEGIWKSQAWILEGEDGVVVSSMVVVLLDCMLDCWWWFLSWSELIRVAADSRILQSSIFRAFWMSVGVFEGLNAIHAAGLGDVC